MNNFQLNNTSVYLGGQCKWDIVLGNYNGQIYIQGFQLTPLSNNVPFNKKGSIDHLNENHSYTLKKYCDSIKENLWSIAPDFNQKLTKDNIDYYSDNSFTAGLRRTSCYPVYHKQFECLQPVWLEKLDDDSYLKFSFNLYSGADKDKKILGSKSFDLNYLDSGGDEKKEKLFSFHNKFVKYFYDWLKMLNIIGIGNNKVINLDLQNNIAQIEGVSTISGQRSIPLSCNYVCDNLLSYERPNIETDYILTSLFKTHDLITSQLFNLCFCFNINDVVDPFFVNQLTGKPVSIGCDVYINDTILDRRTLYTNYEFIKKSIFDPYMLLDKMNVEPTGELTYGYTVKYKYNEVESDKFNVLDYLQDYSIQDIKDVNKISQHIIHWDFVDHEGDIFNLYDGYSGLNSFGGDFELINPDTNEYKVELYNLDKINGDSVIYVNTAPNKNNGALNWINPTKIITVMGKFDENISSKIARTDQSSESILEKDGLWCIEKCKIIFDGDTSELSKLKLSFIQIRGGWYTNNPFDGNRWNEIYHFYQLDGQDKCVILKKSNDQSNAPTYIIITNNPEYFGMQKLMSINDEEFHGYISSINQAIKNMDNKLNFYGFGTELGIGKNDVGDDCLYKTNIHKTYVYRKCGLLSPCLKTDSDYSFNYQYCQSSVDNGIYNISDDGYTWKVEYRSMGTNMFIDIINELNYNIEKNVEDERTVEDLIKEKLNDIYKLEGDSDLIDYIYNLYNTTFKYEYKLETDISNIIYKIKMILK